jgi:arsenate reductase (thioredoxin)
MIHHQFVSESILNLIQSFDEAQIDQERRVLLETLAAYIVSKRKGDDLICLNFICTHNSRRSHLCQIWAQVMAYYFNLRDVTTFSGGTEATAMFSQVIETLKTQGFEVTKLSEGNNTVWSIKYAEDVQPAICFSKTFDHGFNPKHGFAAIMNCDSADEQCPIIEGADHRFSIKYQDPKAYDQTQLRPAKYVERSEQIAREMWFVFMSAARS